jgi:hypothetical protein
MAKDMCTMVATFVLEGLPASFIILGKIKDAAFPQQISVLHLYL